MTLPSASISYFVLLVKCQADKAGSKTRENLGLFLASGKQQHPFEPGRSANLNVYKPQMTNPTHPLNPVPSIKANRLLAVAHLTLCEKVKKCISLKDQSIALNCRF